MKEISCVAASSTNCSEQIFGPETYNTALAAGQTGRVARWRLTADQRNERAEAWSWSRRWAGTLAANESFPTVAGIIYAAAHKALAKMSQALAKGFRLPY